MSTDNESTNTDGGDDSNTGMLPVEEVVNERREELTVIADGDGPFAQAVQKALEEYDD